MMVDSLANLGNQQPPSVCELCAGAHSSDQCAISSESAQFVSSFQRSQQPAPATYHPNNRNHPNFSWSNNQNYMPQQQQQFQQQGSRPFNPSGFQQQFAQAAIPSTWIPATKSWGGWTVFQWKIRIGRIKINGEKPIGVNQDFGESDWANC